MATLVEHDIRNIQACVIMAQPGATPQLLVTYDTVDASGNTIRHIENPDWYPTSAPASQQGIQTLIAVFTQRAKAEAQIP